MPMSHIATVSKRYLDSFAVLIIVGDIKIDTITIHLNEHKGYYKTI